MPRGILYSSSTYITFTKSYFREVNTDLLEEIWKEEWFLLGNYSSGPNNIMVLNKPVGLIFCSPFIGENEGSWISWMGRNSDDYQIYDTIVRIGNI